jgi:hypothetical protein
MPALLPKISNVTPSFNQGQYLEEASLSVFAQHHPNLKYLKFAINRIATKFHGRNQLFL